jgi:hypothetical protein
MNKNIFALASLLGLVGVIAFFVFSGCATVDSGSDATTTTTAPTTTSTTAVTTTTGMSTTTTTAGPSSFTVSGTVRFVSTSDPVMGASTEVGIMTAPLTTPIMTTTANANTGAYSFSGVPAGNYYLASRKPGWTETWEAISVSGNTSSNIRLYPASWEVYFTPVRANLTALEFVQGGALQMLVISGDDGTVYTLEAVAATPQALDLTQLRLLPNTSPEAYLPVTVYHGDLNRYIVVARGGKVYMIPRSNFQWTADATPLPSNIGTNEIISNLGVSGGADTYLYAVRSDNKCYTAVTSAFIWTPLSITGADGNLQNIIVSDRSTFAAGCGKNGLFIKSTGDPSLETPSILGWTAHTIAGGATINDMCFITAPKESYAVTADGSIFVNNTNIDSDGAWVSTGGSAIAGIPYPLNGVKTTGLTAVVIGNNGLIMRHK